MSKTLLVTPQGLEDAAKALNRADFPFWPGEQARVGKGPRERMWDRWADDYRQTARAALEAAGIEVVDEVEVLRLRPVWTHANERGDASLGVLRIHPELGEVTRSTRLYDGDTLYIQRAVTKEKDDE